MDFIFIILFIFTVIFFIFGISQFVGFGWAMFFSDLLFQTDPSTKYSSARRGKLFGAIMIFLSILIFFLVLPRL